MNEAFCTVEPIEQSVTLETYIYPINKNDNNDIFFRLLLRILQRF